MQNQTKKINKLDNSPSIAKRRGNGPQIVYDYLRNEIITMRLSAGDHIEERLIVENLGISRTPVRQALMRMASEGLVEILPNRGARVPPLDLEEVRAFFEAFEIMQKLTIHLAAKRRSDEEMRDIVECQKDYAAAVKIKDIKAIIDTNERFHLTIAKAGHNSHLVRLMADLLTKAVRLDGIWYSWPRSKAFVNNLDRSLEEHENLVQAIRDQDVAGAEQLTLIHSRSFREPFLNFLCESEAEQIKVTS